jgi:hypothetical protein
VQSFAGATRLRKDWCRLPVPAPWATDALVFFTISVMQNRGGCNSCSSWYTLKKSTRDCSGRKYGGVSYAPTSEANPRLGRRRAAPESCRPGVMS